MAVGICESLRLIYGNAAGQGQLLDGASLQMHAASAWSIRLSQYQHDLMSGLNERRQG